ncbi:MAG TPA: hypothetical protein VLA45_12725, partial [Paracoccaceae bacterium]|nr:hypothetical protein [Paracoccaceae bacterium]
MTDFSLGMNVSKERPANTYNGYIALLVLLALAAWILSRIFVFNVYGPGLLGIISLPVSAVMILFVLLGFYMIQPN